MVNAGALTDDMLREREEGALSLECAVEAVCEVPAQFYVLLLVFTYGYVSSTGIRSGISIVARQSQRTTHR